MGAAASAPASLEADPAEPMETTTTPPSPTTTLRRNLVIHLSHHEKGYVRVQPLATLSEVRQKLREEWDENMLPPSDEFYFLLGHEKIRISRKQEEDVTVQELFADGERQERVQIHSREMPVPPTDEANENTMTKKRKLQEEEEETQGQEELPETTTLTNLTKRRRLVIEDQESDDDDEDIRNVAGQETSRSPKRMRLPEEDIPQDDKENTRPSLSEALESSTVEGEKAVEDMEVVDALRQEEQESPSESSNAVSEKDQPDWDALVTSTDNLFASADKESVTVKDILQALEDEYEVSLDEATKQRVRTRLMEVVTNGTIAPTVAAQPETEEEEENYTNSATLSEPQVSDGAESVDASAENVVDSVVHKEKDNDASELDTDPLANRSQEQDDAIAILDDGDDATESLLEMEDRVVVVAEAPPALENDPHRVHNQTLQKSCSVLREMDGLIEQNPLLCSQQRRDEWRKEIAENLEKAAPHTVVGVLGNTGVGKSSLLNALLSEASVLPTSGSRGCTAAVVELRFNEDLKKKQSSDAPIGDNVHVYKGEVEFITLVEWDTELRILLDECSTQEKTLYARVPDPQRQPDAAAAWSKIDQVYGSGTLEARCGKPTADVYKRLSSDPRIRKLLTPQSGAAYNVEVVESGEVQPGSDDAKALMHSLEQVKSRKRLWRSKKRWALDFRQKINNYVYRKGNGSQPQDWPLIRKVVLHGPWPVLSTGACLVDLPGVRDANAARAKVSEHYLQHCNQIWVVAPIKRAVDDGTAKELLGEQFKRRLLMDGQYGNVSFICTQTDDCEATEIMRDHKDVAMRTPGRWERMTDLLDEITTLDNKRSALLQEEEDLKLSLEEAKQEAKASREDVEECEIDDEDSELLSQLQAVAKEKAKTRYDALCQLKKWREANQEEVQRMGDLSQKLQRRLKSTCALVRNEYSKSCLQEDFRAGLEELMRPDEEDTESNVLATPLPENFEMNVFCICANDYLKLKNIKPASDGGANTFSDANDTQVPALRAFVHETTARVRSSHAKAMANTVSDILDHIKLVVSQTGDSSSRASTRLKSSFEAEVGTLCEKVKPIVEDFKRKMQTKVEQSLQPSLRSGADKGMSAALHTVSSWGSKNRRTRQERAPDRNGLYYSTYAATCRRDGVYTSGSAGAIDFNQELCDPMEKEFSRDWQQTMDTTVRTLLAECEAKLLELCDTVNRAIGGGFNRKGGIEPARLASIANAASRSSTSIVKGAFARMRTTASNLQRDLNRSLLPVVQQRMKQGYSSTLSVPRGKGTYNRMKNAMEDHSRFAVATMFSESTQQMLKGIDDMIQNLAAAIASAADATVKTLESIYSVCWEDKTNAAMLMDPVYQEKVRECRDRLLPDFIRLRQSQDEAMSLIGIEREEMELDVMGVDTLETRLDTAFKQAEERGDVICLLDSSDEEDSAEDEMTSKPAAVVRVKPEPNTILDTNFENSLKCPITGMLYEDPVQNKVCHHTYSRAGLMQVLHSGRPRCPIPGCVNKNISLNQVEKDIVMATKVRHFKRWKANEEEQRATQQTEPNTVSPSMDVETCPPFASYPRSWM